MGFDLPDWPAFAGVRALTTTRCGGHSQGVYRSFNTALHVGDSPQNVNLNRARLSEEIGYPIQWLDQVHGTSLVEIEQVVEHTLTADAAMTSCEGVVCAVQTADCLPILICDQHGTQVAAVHAGWRSLAAGILSVTVSKFVAAPERLCAWFGPAISQPYFEVGNDVRDAFLIWAKLGGLDESALKPAFQSLAAGKYLADLYTLARLELEQLGLKKIFGGEACTWRDEEHYFSYRRDGVTGRMTTAIWIEPVKCLGI